MTVIDFLRRISRYLRPYRFQVVVLLLAMLLDSAFETSLPLFVKYLIDHAVLPKRWDVLVAVLLAIGGMALLVSAAGLVRDFLYARCVTSLANDLRLAMFDHLQRLSMGFYGRCQAGDILSRFSNDLNSVESAVINALPTAYMSITQILMSLVFLFALQWKLAMISVLGIFLSFGAARLMEPKATAASYAAKEELGRNTTLVQENLNAPAIIRGFSLQGRLGENYRNETKVLYRITARANLLAYLLERIPNTGILLFGLLVIGGGAWMAFSGSLSVGGLMAFYGLFFNLTASISGLTWVFPQVLQAGAGIRRIEELLSESAQIVDAPGAPALSPFRREIAFRNVSFSYTGERVNLDDVSLTIRRGERVAFVGPSGSGKSTLLALLARFHDPAAGHITIDGVELRHATRDSIRGQMGIVFQDNFLFNTTLRENIRMAKQDATDEEVVGAAEQAEIHDFIQSLPDGYDTLAGEGGGRFSMGQRQRIAIARAILRDPALLLLDEATSALDTPTEHAIREMIYESTGDRTVISVTHRLSLAVEADRIFVMDGGRLVESGNHVELLAAGGLYTRLWKKQGGFKISADGDRMDVEPSRLREIPILESLENAMLAELSRAFVIENYPENRMVFDQGDNGDKFYIVTRGMVSVSHTSPSGENKRLAVLSTGDHFGEMALVKDVPRNASIHTLTPSTFLTLPRSLFQDFLSRAPSVRESVQRTVLERADSFRDAWETDRPAPRQPAELLG